MDLEEENNLDSESEDEDYVPAAETGEKLSEEEDDGEEKVAGESPRKRKKVGDAKKKVKRRKREDDSDDEEDADFSVSDKDLEEEDEDQEDIEDPEIIAKREKEEKARTDVLWADFQKSVEETKAKKQTEKETGGNLPREKTVTKIYEFAGEKIKIQEKVRIEAPKSIPGPSSSITNEEGSSSASSSSSNGTSNGIITHKLHEDSDKPRRYRISFLSGNPSDIGLSNGGKGVSAKEGLANVLNALQARNKKLGTLEKSKLDWEDYKRSQNMEEELALHNRSKNGFIDKQEFLQRTDLRQFEIEKAARSKRRKNVI